MSDLISKEVILNKIAEIDKLSKTGKTDEALALMKECFESLTPKQTEWISVKDRLPKDAEAVLITIRRMDKSFNQIPFISVGYISWNQQAWWCAHDGDCEENNIEVLAWMPLPSPYKGE